MQIIPTRKVQHIVEGIDTIPVYDLKSKTDYKYFEFFCNNDSGFDKYNRGFYFEARVREPGEKGLAVYLSMEELISVRDEINKALAKGAK